jgi:hypothetical protein
MASGGQQPIAATPSGDGLRTATAARGRGSFWPRSRRGRRLATACLLLVALGGAAGVVLLTFGSSTPQSKYGLIPDWLPKPTVPVGRIVQASAAHRWLAIQGDTVSVQLTQGHVLATAVGPAIPSSIPQEAEENDVETSPGTFTVTLASASGVVPLNPRAFTIVENGRLYHPRFPSGRLPARVAPGRTVTLTMKAVLPEGDGSVRWAPNGGTPIVAWEFNLELD